MELVSIEKLGIDPKYYPRRNGKADWYTVNRYCERLKTNPAKADANNQKANPFPPIIAVRRPNWDWPFMIIDGLHRWNAFRQAGYEEIWTVVKRLPESKWLRAAFEINFVQEHRDFDPMDLAWCAERFIADGMKENEVASLMEISVEKLQKIRVERVEKIGKKEADDIRKNGGIVHKVNGGNVVIKKGALKTLHGGKSFARAGRAQQILHSATPERVLDECISLLESGVIDTKQEAIVERLLKLLSLLERYSLV